MATTSTTTTWYSALTPGARLGQEQYRSDAPYMIPLTGSSFHLGSDVLGQANAPVYSLTGGTIDPRWTGPTSLGVITPTNQELVYLHVQPRAGLSGTVTPGEHWRPSARSRVATTRPRTAVAPSS